MRSTDMQLEVSIDRSIMDTIESKNNFPRILKVLRMNGSIKEFLGKSEEDCLYKLIIQSSNSSKETLWFMGSTFHHLLLNNQCVTSLLRNSILVRKYGDSGTLSTESNGLPKRRETWSGIQFLAELMSAFRYSWTSYPTLSNAGWNFF